MLHKLWTIIIICFKAVLTFLTLPYLTVELGWWNLGDKHYLPASLLIIFGLFWSIIFLVVTFIAVTFLPTYFIMLLKSEDDSADLEAEKWFMNKVPTWIKKFDKHYIEKLLTITTVIVAIWNVIIFNKNHTFHQLHLWFW